MTMRAAKAMALFTLLGALQPALAEHTVWPQIHKNKGDMVPETCLAEVRKLQAKGKDQDVLELLDICLRDRPDVVALYFYRAQTYMKMKRFREALLDCTAQIKLERRISKPYEMRAQCYLALNDRKRACKDWLRVVELQPDNAYGHQQLALFYKQEGDLANWKRQTLLAKSSKAGKAKNQQNITPEVLTRHDHPVSGLLQDAGENLAHGKPGLALDACKKLLEFPERDLAVEHINQGEIYDLQGQAFQQMDIHDQAVTAFNQVSKFQPGNNRVYYLRAQSYFALGKYGLCVDDCDRASRGDKILSNAVAQLRMKAAAHLQRHPSGN